VIGCKSNKSRLIFIHDIFIGGTANNFHRSGRSFGRQSAAGFLNDEITRISGRCSIFTTYQKPLLSRFVAKYPSANYTNFED